MPDSATDHSTIATPFCAILGTSGLALSGFGVLPASHAWAWLAVLVVGLVLPVLRELAADARTRTDELRRSRDASDNARHVLRHHVDAWEKRLEGVITPEESRRLRADFNAMVIDFAKLRSEVETVAKEQRVREMGDSIFPEVS